MPASTLEEVDSCFRNEPVKIEDFDEFYVPADEGRGKSDFRRLKRHLSDNPSGNCKILLAGHRGCGKSTELVRLQKDIESDFVILNFSITKELDILNLSYIELFIATMEKLFEFFNQEKRIKIKNEHIENIKRWISSREIMEINNDYIGVDIEAGVGGKANIPAFVNFFAKFKAAAKSSTSMKEVLKRKVEPKLSELISNCNMLIEEIKSQLTNIDKNGLLIIMEDLDKVNIEKGEDIFYIHSTQLTQLDCHCIFTFPIALLYHIKFNTIKNNFELASVLPMIKVFDKNGIESPDGIRIMEDIIRARMDFSLFVDNNIIKDMIKKSGGCLWDLFRLIKDAADNALDFEKKQIDKDDFESAYKSLKADYERTIAENKEKDIKVQEYYEALVKCAKDEKKKPEWTDVILDLMNNLTVLNYNGDNWHDVHPVVKDILQERGLLNHEPTES
jgi:GTPase SAR1 family protein